MTASIKIPSQANCNDSISSGDLDYDWYSYYDNKNICNGEVYCLKNESGTFYYYYDFSILFGDCSKQLRLNKGDDKLIYNNFIGCVCIDCQSIIVTSITTNMKDLFFEIDFENTLVTYSMRTCTCHVIH